MWFCFKDDHLPISREESDFSATLIETYIPSSDLDVVVIGPKFASREIEFFGQLYSMIRCHPSTLNIRCIKTAKVPLIRFKMYEVVVDVAYAHLNSLHVPKEEEWGKILEDGVFCDSMDKESLLALESMAVNYLLHHL